MESKYGSAAGDASTAASSAQPLFTAAPHKSRVQQDESGRWVVTPPDNETLRETHHGVCETMVADAKKKSPMIKHLMRAIKERGCTVPSDFLMCAPCAGGKARPAIAGGFVHEKGQEKVVICEEVASRKLARRTLVHELIHAYDACRAHLDFDNIYHVACTEVRAANLSTDCSFTTEVSRLNFGVAKQQQACVKRRAAISIQHSPALGDADPEKVVDAIFERCYRDTAPFPGVP